ASLSAEAHSQLAVVHERRLRPPTPTRSRLMLLPDSISSNAPLYARDYKNFLLVRLVFLVFLSVMQKGETDAASSALFDDSMDLSCRCIRSRSRRTRCAGRPARPARTPTSPSCPPAGR